MTPELDVDDLCDSVPARILCPRGAPLVHAFGGPAPDIAGIVAQATEELLALRAREKAE